MRVTIFGKSWDLIFTSRRIRKEDDGHCEHVNEPGKQICIRSRLRGEHFLEVLLHETLHAADWWKDEEWVQAVARDQAHIVCTPDVIVRLIDCPKLLQAIEPVLAKHGYHKD